MKHADQQQTVNARTGKIERVFVDLEAVYPNDNDLNEEMSFEELRAKSRGWLDRDWAAESKQRMAEESQSRASSMLVMVTAAETQADAEIMPDVQSQPGTQDSTTTLLDNTIAVDIGRASKGGRTKKMKIKEVRGETQTSACAQSRLLIFQAYSYSQNKPRIAYWAEAEAEELCRAYHDSPHQSRHGRHSGYLQPTIEKRRSHGRAR